MAKRILVAAAFTFLFGCSKVTVENATDKFLPGKPLAELDNKKLEEISGAVSSVNNPDLFWVHNDSGNDAEVFLIDEKLNIVLTCVLENIKNRDWEDIAVGPGPEDGKTYLYIAEIGDNLAQYNTKYIYRFEEPEWDKSTSSLTISKVDTISFSLDERKDSETLLLDPKSKDLFVVSKREKPVWIYRLAFPQELNKTIQAEKLISLPLTQIVGGDISPDGNQLLLKNYEHVYYWEKKEGQTFEQVLAQKPFEVPYTIEPQGEAITWARDMSGFFTISEKKKSKPSHLYFYERRK